jgi:hypothetical protein
VTDPQCLHCLIGDLLQAREMRGVETGPQEVGAICEVLGDIIASIEGDEQKREAQRFVLQILLEAFALVNAGKWKLDDDRRKHALGLMQ